MSRAREVGKQGWGFGVLLQGSFEATRGSEQVVHRFHPKSRRERDLRVSGPPGAENWKHSSWAAPQNVNHGQSLFSPKQTSWRWGGQRAAPQVALRPTPRRPTWASRELSGHRPQGIKKPYNPILGETFRCRWPHPHTRSHTFYIAEQARPGRPTPAHVLGGPPAVVGFSPELRSGPGPGTADGISSGGGGTSRFPWTPTPLPWAAGLRGGNGQDGCGGAGGGGSVILGAPRERLRAHRCPTTHPCPPSTSATGGTASASAAASQPSPAFTVRGLPWAVRPGGDWGPWIQRCPRLRGRGHRGGEELRAWMEAESVWSPAAHQAQGGRPPRGCCEGHGQGPAGTGLV